MVIKKGEELYLNSRKKLEIVVIPNDFTTAYYYLIYTARVTQYTNNLGTTLQYLLQLATRFSLTPIFTLLSLIYLFKRKTH